MEWWTPIKEFGAVLFTQAGIVAFTFFWWNIYLVIDNRSLRKENRELNKEYNKTVLNMGMQMTAAMVENNNVLDKIGDFVATQTERKP